MRFRFPHIWAFLLLLLISCGPLQPNEKAVAKQPRGEEFRVTIPGAHCSIIPPAGFKPAAGFIGLEGPNGETIIMEDLPNASYLQTAGNFSREAFEARGASVLDYQETTVGNYPAKWALLQYGTDPTSFALAFGDALFCVIVTGPSEPESEQDLKASFNTIRYGNIKQGDLSNFSIDEKKTNFKIIDINEGLYTYSLNSTPFNQQIADEDVKLISVIPLDAFDEGTLDSLFTTAFKKIGLSGIRIINKSRESISGYPSHQLEITGAIQGTPVLLYIVYLTKDKKAVMMQGVTNFDFEKSLIDFKKFSQSITLNN